MKGPMLYFTAIAVVFAVVFAVVGGWCAATLFGAFAIWMLWELWDDHRIRRGRS